MSILYTLCVYTCVYVFSSYTSGITTSLYWPFAGGVATSLCRESEMIRPDGAIPGDVLVLTKPLGTQLAVNAWQWRAKPERWAKIDRVISVEDAGAAFDAAGESMGRLNVNGALADLVEQRVCLRDRAAESLKCKSVRRRFHQ